LQLPADHSLAACPITVEGWTQSLVRRPHPIPREQRQKLPGDHLGRVALIHGPRSFGASTPLYLLANKPELIASPSPSRGSSERAGQKVVPVVHLPADHMLADLCESRQAVGAFLPGTHRGQLDTRPDELSRERVSVLVKPVSGNQQLAWLKWVVSHRSEEIP